MKKAPAFQFYVQDFLVGTMLFNATEVGAYILLLCYQWDNVFIPEDEIEFIAKTEKDKLVRVLKKFTKSDHGYQNKRLEVVRQEQEEYRKKQSERGKASAEKRWGNGNGGYKKDNAGYKNLNGGYNPVTVRLQPEDNPSSSSSPSNKAKLEKSKIFEIMRMKTDRNRISDRQIHEEVAEFIIKYEGQNIKSMSALVSTWAGNIQPAEVKKMVI